MDRLQLQEISTQSERTLRFKEKGEVSSRRFLLSFSPYPCRSQAKNVCAYPMNSNHRVPTLHVPQVPTSAKSKITLSSLTAFCKILFPKKRSLFFRHLR